MGVTPCGQVLHVATWFLFAARMWARSGRSCPGPGCLRRAAMMPGLITLVHSDVPSVMAVRVMGFRMRGQSSPGAVFYYGAPPGGAGIVLTASGDGGTIWRPVDV